MLKKSSPATASDKMGLRVIICRSNPIAPDPRVEKIAQTLSAAGYSVGLLGWDRTGELAADAQSNGVRIQRLMIKAGFGRGLGNLPGLLRWQIALMFWLARHRKTYDLIHACDFDTILPALACKRLWGKKVVYDIFDFYADHLRATPDFLKKLIRRVDLRAIGMADGLILVDDSRWEQIAGAHPRHSAVIFNSPDEAALPASPAQPAGQGLRLAYIGLLQVERGLFQMLDLLKRHPDWTLDLAGFGGDEEKLCQAARRLPNVNWHGRVPYDQALRLSQAADVLFATYDPAIPNHRYSSPNKVFEAMMLAKPIIVARGTNMDRIIEEAGCGIVINYGDQAALEDSLARLQADEGLRCRLGENARRAYENKYRWPIMQARLLELYRQVCS
jgi:glycosyltransferase involved in cell wall biosynthesis